MKAAVWCVFVVASASCLCAREPVWVFNNGPDAELISLGQGQLSCVAGLTTLIPTGSDLTVSLSLGPGNAFAADERPFFALRYKYQTTILQAGLSLTTDSPTALSDESVLPFPVVGDNTWRTAIVDLRQVAHKRWTGLVTGCRLAPTRPSDTRSSYEISRLGFLASQAEAQRFLDAAVDVPDYAQPTYFVGPMERVLVPGGCLYDGLERADFTLQSARVDTPSESTVVRFRAKGAAADESIVPLCQTNSRGFTHFVAKKPGTYRLGTEGTLLQDIAGVEADARSAIRFVVGRRLLEAPDGQFHPDDPLADADWQRAAAALAEYDVHLDRPAGAATRVQAAVVLRKAVETALGTVIESSFTHAHLTRDRIRLGACVSPRAEAIGDDFVEIYSAAGFDWIVAYGALAGAAHSHGRPAAARGEQIIAHGALPSGAYREMLLRDCDRYGVELFLGDGAYENPTVATAEYFDHPCFAGTYVTDEPGTERYDELAAICNAYFRDMNGRLPLVNLLPMYANAAQLKFGASAATVEYDDPDPELYKKYCDLFCEQFDAPYICTDIYPLNWVDGKRTTYAQYCEAINVIATSARQHNKDFWCCIQTFAWDPAKRTPTESEFRWQAYCLLSFGCKGLLCWRYAGYQPQFPALLTSEGKRTNAWYDAATVVQEMRRISDAFVGYRNIGAFAHNCTDATPFLKFSNPVASLPAIRLIQCEDPLLVGCFTARHGGATAFTIVNMSELEMLKTTEIGLDIAGSTVVAWPRGQRTELTPSTDGRYHLTLAPGEGVLVEVEE